MTAGTHGSTFGGNPIACAGANAVLDIVTADGFMDEVRKKGKMIKEEINSWNSSLIKEIRGKGLMIGIQIEGTDVKDIVPGLLKKGLVVLTAGQNVLRLLPPLTITEEEINKGLNIMGEYFA